MLIIVLLCDSYLGFLNSIVPCGVVSWYVKSASRSCLARSLFVVPSTIHSPVSKLSRCMCFCVVLLELFSFSEICVVIGLEFAFPSVL